MASKIDICNKALLKLGQSPIMSIDENSTLARQCSTEFEQALGVVLRSYPWPFAIRRAKLVMSSEKPQYGYENYFVLPGDIARIHEFDTGENTYQIEGKFVATDASEVNLRYVTKNIDPIDLDDQTVDVVALHLAYRLCLIVTENMQLKDMLFAEYNTALTIARNTWSVEDYPQEVTEGTWLVARKGSVSFKDTFNPWGPNGTGENI